MEHIASPTQIKEIMRAHNLNFHKGLGQNFLFDAHFLEQIVESASLTRDDTVLEIGPGLGVLTTRMAEKAKKVIAVEIDSGIVPVLADLTKEFDNVEIINRDILKTNLAEILPQGEKVKVVANIPYYITSPIIMKLLAEKSRISSIVIMIQKEVANRIVAKPASKDYSALTVAVQYYANPQKCVIVPAGAFVPPPKVDSAVLRLTIPDTVKFCPDSEKIFFKTVKSAFGQRRKTLANGLAAGFPDIGKARIKEILAALSFSETVRGETLSIADFIKISNFFAAERRNLQGSVE